MPVLRRPEYFVVPSIAARVAEPIAVVGIGCRFPGGVKSPSAFWRLLRDGVDAVSEVPTDRWDIPSHYDPDADSPGKMISRWGGFLQRIDEFDALFFGISPREAAAMDPQQRLLLEMAWEALENAGLVPEQLAGSDASVFVGISNHDYGTLQMGSRDAAIEFDHYVMTGSALSIAANRISYFFDFRGPSMAVDTACSSSLVATHLACESLWSGTSALSLACGVNALLTPQASIGFSKASMLSPDGRCKAFDARANGYVRGEGAGVVVLKLLSRAIADGDPIIALIRGTAINHDGHTQGMTVPGGPAQEALLRDACRRAGISPDAVQYVEAHGTGTPVGDPIEAAALGAVLSEGRADGNCCRVGSVKTNIGHLESASGIAGLIKTALALQHREIPGNLNFQTPNPRIEFDKLKLRVQQVLEPWPARPGSALAGVNSFGFGGTNAHAILSDAPPPLAGAVEPMASAYLFPVSAQSPEALDAAVRALRDFLQGPDASTASLHDLCYTAGARRHHHAYRHALAVQSRDELIEQLDTLAGRQAAGASFAGKVSGRKSKLTFVFSGMGPQWWAMGRQLLEEEPLFRETIAACDALLRQHAEWSLIAELKASESESRMTETWIAQPASFALQIALARLWRSWGIEPDAIVGHSAGEVAAAHVAGALTLDDAIRVIFHRSRLQQRTSGYGKMLAVGMTAADAQELVRAYAGRVCIGAINSPRSITVAGDSDALEQVAESLAQNRVFCRFLTGTVPYHSHHMDALRPELLESLASVRPRTAAIPLYSTVTGDIVDGRQLDAEYWWRNVREPVLFSNAVTALIASGCKTFVELSAHPVLSSAIAENLAGQAEKGTVLPSLRRNEEERLTMLASLGALHTTGVSIDWIGLYPNGGTCVQLPSYPWQRERFWLEPEEAMQERLGVYAHPLLGRRRKLAMPTWQVDLDRRRLAYLGDHRVQGRVVYPAAGYVEMALAAGRQIFGGDVVCEDLEFQRALFLLDQSTPSLQFVFDEQDSTFNVFSRASETAEGWTHHATGRLREARTRRPTKVADLGAIRNRCSNELLKEDCYAILKRLGLHYGPCHQGIARLWLGSAEALGEIVVPDALPADDQYLLHPAVLDACFQVLLGAVPTSDPAGDDKRLYLPVGIERIRVFRGHGRRLWSHARLSACDSTGLEGTIVLFDEDGAVVADVHRLRCHRVQSASTGAASDDFYESRWISKTLPGRASLRPSVDFIPPLGRIADELRTEACTLAEKRERRDYYETVAPMLDAQAAAYIVLAFRQLGFPFLVGDKTTAESLVARFGIASQYERLVGRMLEKLEQRGVLARVAAEFVVRIVPEPIDLENARLSLLEQYPDHESELELLTRCGSNLAEVLQGKTDALQLLFPQGAAETIEHFHRESPSFFSHNSLACSAVAAALKRLPPERTLRVLEIGAGTGGLTSHVLAELPTHKTEYVFTDVSGSLVAAAEQRWSDHPYVEFRQLDLGQDPRGQGFEAHSFDVILASDVMHATTSLTRTLDNVRMLLNSNGLLLLIEFANTPLWAELTFGLLRGWWSFDDVAARPSRPWISSAEWCALLAGQGFAEATDVQEAERSSLHSLVLARAPGFEIAAQPTASTVDISGERKSWLILADRGGIGRQLSRLLRSRGEVVVLAYATDGADQIDTHDLHVAADDAQQIERLVEHAAATAAGWQHVVHLWSLDSSPTEQMTAADVAAAQVLGCESVVHLVQAFAKLERTRALPGLVLVTRGAQITGFDGATLPPLHSALWGVGRVAANEMRQLRCTMIDLDPAGDADEAGRLFAEMCSGDQENAVAFRFGERYANRLVRLATLDPEPPAPAADQEVDGQGFRLDATRPGLLEGLQLTAHPRTKPGRGEVEIQVKAVGLNFRDVMKALGIYPADAGEGSWLGDECAGTIVAVGDGVAGFSVGDDVVCIAPNCFGAYVTAPAAFVKPKPSGLTHEEAATIPIVFLTSYYALHHLARIERGESILIHAAAGGVGMAAIQIAQQAGAEVFATAGSAEKRDVVTSLGVKHIMDSRSLDFADDVLELTEGEGVDVVLNSLAGDAIPKSLSVLRAHGRFLEIGKRDIYQNSKLALRPFKQNVSFFAVDLSKAIRTRPALLSEMFSELMRHFESGVLQPLARRVYPMRDVVGAFRRMAQAKHIGKIVVALAEGDRPPIVPEQHEEPLFRFDASYLVTGGCGGFGLAVAQWMAAQGARHLVLVGRRGVASEEAAAAIEGLRRAGCQVRIANVDVTHEKQVVDLLVDIAGTMPPLRGVVHAAMVLDDAFVLQQTTERMRSVMAPKVAGAWNLHRLTLEESLDFFVMFSSFSSLVGNPGQANYVAANSFLDSLAQFRRARGLPALTMNWGAVAEVGYVARHSELGRHLERLGIAAFAVDEATAILGSAMRGKRAQFGAARVDWRAIFDVLPQVAASTQFSRLARADSEQAEGTESTDALIKKLLATPADQRLRLLGEFLRDRVAAVLGAQSSKLDIDLPIADLGVDSLMAVELETVVRTELGLDLPPGLLLDRRVTISELGKQILSGLTLEARDTESLLRAAE